MEEVQLIEGLKKRDKKILSILYDRYGQALMGIIFRIVGNQALSEEVLQDVFVKAWYRIGQFDASKGRFSTWLINIARNAARDKCRSREFIQSSKNQTFDNFVSSLESFNASDLRAEYIGIRESIQKLDTKYAIIIDHVYFQGYSHADAAEKLDIPLGTLKTRLRHGIHLLRKYLDA